MDIQDIVWGLDGENGNFSWFVKKYLEKLVKEKFESLGTVEPKLPIERDFEKQYESETGEDPIIMNQVGYSKKYVKWLEGNIENTNKYPCGVMIHCTQID